MTPNELSALASYLETLPEPHILCDREYRIVAANAAYRERCTGGEDAVGKTCYEVSHRYGVPCDQAGEVCPLKRSLASGERERVVHLHHGPHGEIYESIELSPVRDAAGAVTHFVEKLEEISVARGLADTQGLIGRSPAFRAMLELLLRVAPSDATVLLQGESGTGKELAARAIHVASRRARGPFVVLDCSGLPETLFESELFGHERGAFTGALARRTGLVEAASGGTLFLDEAGDIPFAMQVKLLRLLETGTFRRVGSTELRTADFRLISATHQPLRQMAAEGRFRQDLFFRLNTFPLRLPALRERRDDIPLLAEALLARVAGPGNLRISPEALKLFRDYDYPGNIRELRNLLERASLLCDGSEIQPWHLAEELHAEKSEAGDAPANGAAVSRLREAASSHKGTCKALARRLGLSERTLYRRLAEANLTRGGTPPDGE